MPTSSPSPRVAILLSTYNGERFLAEQLASIVGQTWSDWTLYWRDDGSRDGSIGLMRSFAAEEGCGRCVPVPVEGHLGITASYFALLRHAAGDGAEVVAFADQDDVWLPDKLRRGLDALAGEPADRPALYSARQILVDEGLTQLSLSFDIRRPPGFLAALTQNIATGCTVQLNAAAVQLAARSHPPSATLHDWWCYLIVAGAGGRIIVDDTPVVLYRQHPGNVVGAPCSLRRRAFAAVRRGPGVFMAVFRQHVEALRSQPELLCASARSQLMTISRALDSGMLTRLTALRLQGFRRQTWQETLLFQIWFLRG